MMFFSFDIGDYLIHRKYGIGRFVGMDTLSINGTTLDFFKIEYLDQSFLLIPSYNIGVFKFHSDKNANTKIESLGRSSVVKKENKLRAEIEKTAKELNEIYKARFSVKVHSIMMKDSVNQFMQTFPYKLTKSQEKALNEILNDLSDTRPMDRLLCGDVGFGKTEVAARAIAVCLANDLKAIFLVPTTILASQHYKNLHDRLLLIGKKTLLLSKLSDDALKAKASWNKGEFDLLITTPHHKGIDALMRDDVGLVVLDEEHHFGVKFKEKIRLKTHFLQLSATPIPRTLHLSLSKIKDISLLELPPVGRKAVQVYIEALEDVDLKKIILDEVANNGKIFLVVPRIQFIEEIEKLVPYVKYVVLHGQLAKEEAKVALDAFLNNKVHVLLCTNIIESGMDVMGANMMIVFYAHMFGLAQLHQLRGRVGRSQDQGIIYFITSKSLKDISFERLSLIKENSSVGSGFSLSMQDLELRGSGTVVGDKQSGKDYGFGIEMYFDILSECIENKKHTATDSKIAWVGFNNAIIPKEYIMDDKVRFSFYKKLSNISSLRQLIEIEKDLHSFGDCLESVDNFLLIVKINLIARYLNLIKVVNSNMNITLFYKEISVKLFVYLQQYMNIDCVEKKIVILKNDLNKIIEVFEHSESLV